MVFNIDSQRFALPLNYIRETFYVQKAVFKTVYHRELYLLRDELLPLTRLAEKLNCHPENNGKKLVIVIQYQNERRGFVIDEILDEEEIVVKKLDPLLSDSYYSGVSIYADGLPILILDPRRI